MATPSYATDLQDIYTDTDNFSTVGGGRATAAETDDYIQGSNCWSHDPFSTGTEGGMYDTGTAPTIPSGDCVFTWTKCDVAATLSTHAGGGIQLIQGNATTAYYSYYVLGSDDYQYGGWKCIPVDPTKTASASTTVGSPTGTLDWFGVAWYVPATGASKGYPMKIDAIRYGRQIEVTAGDSGDPATWAKTATHDATTTRQWGICQPNDAGVQIQGIVYYGTASASCYFDDSSGETVIIIDTEWTATDFTKIIIDHASTTFNMDGLTVKALGTNNPGQLVFNNASTTAALDNNVFSAIGITTLRAGVTATNCKWTLTSTVTQNGATLDTCTFDNLSSSTSLVVDDIDIVTDCTFNSDGSNHAVNLGTIAASDSVAWDNYLNGYEAYSAGGTSTGNEAILVNVASGQTLTVNVGAGYDTPSYYNTGSGDVDVVSSVTLVIDLVDSDGVTVTETCEVTVVKDSDTSILYHDENVTTGTTSYPFDGSLSATDIYINVINVATYEPVTVSGITLPAANASISIALPTDRNYST